MSPQNPERIVNTVELGGEALMIRRCRSCARLLAPLITTCTSCHSMALDWVRSSGDGSIVSWKVVHRVPCDRRFEEWEPSIIAIVELDEGPWVYTTIEGEIPPPSDQPVRVKFEPRPAG
ncbi:Zn-ribbon domain-containing OB-fold protein, partial [Nocardia xishanensis]